MERRWERNIAEPKFELKSFRLSSCVSYKVLRKKGWHDHFLDLIVSEARLSVIDTEITNKWLLNGWGLVWCPTPPPSEGGLALLM